MDPAPNKIFLQIEDEFDTFDRALDWTWASDRINDSDIEYQLGVSLDTYQIDAGRTMIVPVEDRLIYCALGLPAEVGEVLNILKKIVRGDEGFEAGGDEVKDELGDVLWYVANLATACGWSLEAIAKHNLAKLADRKEKGTLGQAKERDNE